MPKTGYLKVKVIPRSPKNEITEVFEDENNEKVYKIRINAIPERGKANLELIKFLSKELNIPRSNISIISGKADQTKLLKLSKI